MAEVQTASVRLAYAEEDTTIMEFAIFLIKNGMWFDVRPSSKHRWAIVFNGEVAPPAKLAKKLIAPPKETLGAATAASKVPPKDLASYKTAKKKAMKGKRR